MAFWTLAVFLSIQLFATVAKAAEDRDPLAAIVTLVIYPILLYCLWTLK